jgi:hypothetical protein
MIYCVVPPELEDELFDRLVAYYSDNPDVTVIIDRRTGPNRRQLKPTEDVKQQRVIRDRRRARPTGVFLTTEPPID